MRMFWHSTGSNEGSHESKMPGAKGVSTWCPKASRSMRESFVPDGLLQRRPTADVMRPRGRHKRLLRRSAFAAQVSALIFLGLWCARGPAVAADPDHGVATKVRIGVFSGIVNCPEVAIDQDFFRDENLDVELVFLQAGPALMAATSNGSVDISYGDAVAWAAAVGNGFTNLKLIQAGTIKHGNGNEMHFLAARRSGIVSAANLGGRTVGLIPTPLMIVASRLWLVEHGVEPATVKFVTVADGMQGPALQGGSADVVLTRNTATNLRLARDYKAIDLGSPFGALPDGISATAYYANETWLEKNPEAAKRTVRALRKAARFFNSSTVETKAAIASKYIGINYRDVEKEIPGAISKTEWDVWSDGPINVQLTQNLIDFAARSGIVPKSIDIAAHFHPTATLAEIK
jgi:NitT/TauT family transport system substrate-binding protein